MEAKKRKKIIYWSIAIVAGITVQYYLGWLISFKPAFNGRVIDAETKESIEGAVVAVIYRWYPIIGPPGGVNSVEYDARETLTNEKGEFHIPLTLVITGPFGIRPYVDFIIFKPGYGSYPDYHVSPPSPGVGPEEFFTGELGEKGEVEWLSKKISVTYGVVELPRVKTIIEQHGIRPTAPFPVLPRHLERKLPMLRKLSLGRSITSD